MVRPHHFIHLSGIVAIAAVASSAVFAYADVATQAAAPVPTEMPVIEAHAQESGSADVTVIETSSPEPVQVAPRVPPLGLPVTDAFARVTKKRFASYITPETSPVANDRFTGYHVGVDFETFEHEQDVEIAVSAVCDGPLLLKGFAKGYGGYALQSCEIGGERVAVVYGHLHLERIGADPQDQLTRGQTVGVLGKGYSKETDGVRKHLHLGIRRGTEVDIRGYVQEADDVDAWIDPLPLMH